MSSDEDKPPAPPVRLTSNRGTDRGDSVASVDMRPLPKGRFHTTHLNRNFQIKKDVKVTECLQVWSQLSITLLL